MQSPDPIKLSKMLSVGQLVAAAAVLGMLCCVLLAYQFITLRQALIDDMNVQAAIISDNVAASLMFKDREAAAEMLHSFWPSPFLASASVSDRNGAHFAAYYRHSADDSPPALHAWSFAPISVKRPISYRGAALGHIVLVAETGGIGEAMLRYGALLAVASLSAMVATALVTRRVKVRMRRTEYQLEYLAYTDPVTDLPNRRYTYEKLETRLAASRRKGGRVGLLLIDLDNFKAVNDTAGHAAGDRLLRLVASIIRATIRPSDCVGRIGGDEFVVIVSPLGLETDLADVAQRILEKLRCPLQLDGLEMMPTASIGASVFPEDASGLSELLSNADVAMYRAKENGRNNLAIFRREMVQVAQRRAKLERDLRHHLETDMLTLAYQPQYACVSQAMVGVEALLRWNHPEHGPISPAEFIPIAEESGLIVDLGRWALERACLDAVTLERLTGVALTMAVNVSARQLREKNFIDVVRQTLANTGMRADRLELELTESMLMDDLDAAVEFMHKVRLLGVRLSIDDFGTGHSSLAYLQNFPIDHLKIDRSFVSLLPGSGTMIASAIIQLAHGFNLTVIAEGVENAQQLQWLKDAGCDYVQGYLLARPQSFAMLGLLVKAELAMPALEQHR